MAPGLIVRVGWPRPPVTALALATALAGALACPGCAVGGPANLAVLAAGEHARSLGARTRTSGCHPRDMLPDPACTPGAVRVGATVAQICVPGYARSVRDVPEALKLAVYAEYGVTYHRAHSYEIDHLVPLELGGANSAANLWPQAAPGYHQKDAIEDELHDAVCSRHLGLAAAQRQIARDWRATLR